MLADAPSALGGNQRSRMGNRSGTSRPELSKSRWQRTRKAVRDRDGNCCRSCGASGKWAKLSVHHLLPASLGGTDEMDNLITLCSTCHPRYEQAARTLTPPVDTRPARTPTQRRNGTVSRCWCGGGDRDCSHRSYCRTRFGTRT